jgi:hypothetical protein
MSFQGEMALGKWLVKQGHAPQDMVEKCLKALQKSEKEGLKSPPLLKMLYQQGVFGKEEVLEIQREWKERNSKPSVSASARGFRPSLENQPSEDHPEPEASNVASTTLKKLEPKSASDISKNLGATAKADPEKLEPAKPEPAKVVAATTCKCPECQSSNSGENKNCSTCGAPLLRKNVLQCGYCATLQPKSNKHCGSCGCQVVSGKPGPKSRICLACKSALKAGEIICLGCGAPYVSKKRSSSVVFGSALLGLQLLALGASLVVFQQPQIKDPSKASSSESTALHTGDPYEGLSPRAINFNGMEKLSEEDRLWLQSALKRVERKEWDALSVSLEDREDRLGVHGALLLGLCFFQSNRGEELLSLQKAIPHQEDLKMLAAAWRLKQARSDLKSFEGWKAYQTLLPILNSGEATAVQYFWGGVIAFSEQNHEEAVEWFGKGLACPKPVHQSHLFLYLLLKKEDPEKAKEALRKLLEEAPDKKAMEKLASPYKVDS